MQTEISFIGFLVLQFHYRLLSSLARSFSPSCWYSCPVFHRRLPFLSTTKRSTLPISALTSTPPGAPRAAMNLAARLLE